MARHDHHLHEGDSLRNAAKARLQQRGEQWTDMRQSVFDALAVRGIAADSVTHSKPQAGEPLTPAMLEELKHCDLVVTALAN